MQLYAAVSIDYLCEFVDLLAGGHGPVRVPSVEPGGQPGALTPPHQGQPHRPQGRHRPGGPGYQVRTYSQIFSYTNVLFLYHFNHNLNDCRY